MSRFISLSLSLLLGSACMLAAPPELAKAKKLVDQQDYKAALAQYKAALNSNFDKSPKDIQAIKSGINYCETQLKKDSRKNNTEKSARNSQSAPSAQSSSAPQLTVNGSATPTISLAGEGGHKKITISTNQGEPMVYNLPDWMIVTDVTPSSMTVLWDPNTSAKPRSDNFTITAGAKTINVKVNQAGGKSNFLQVTGAQFANTRSGAILTDFGEPLYADEMRFLTADLKYNGPADYETHNVNVKIINPNGTLRTTPYSPEGYTYNAKIEFEPGWEQAVYLPGVGRGDCSTFDAGLYRIEIYIDDDYTYASNLYINAKGGNTSYITFDDRSVADSFFPSSAQTNIHTVRSDGEWTTMDLPTWCSASKQGNRLTLTATTNESSSPRDGYMTIKSGDKTMKVALHQAGR